jgi:hypothetical protein
MSGAALTHTKRKGRGLAALCCYKADNASHASGAHPHVVFIGDSITEFWQQGDPSLFRQTPLTAESADKQRHKSCCAFTTT